MSTLDPMFEAQQSTELRESTERAFREGNNALGQRLYQEQEMNAVQSDVMVSLQGGDPMTEVLPMASDIDPDIRLQRMVQHMGERDRQISATLDQHGWREEIQPYFTNLIEQYKERNDAALARLKPGASEEERMEALMQLQPLEIDPNEIADMRQRLVKLDNAMKAIDPSSSVFKNPKTRMIAAMLNRETGGGAPGYFVSGGQEMDYGAWQDAYGIDAYVPDFAAKGIGFLAQGTFEASKGIVDPGMNFFLGTMEMGAAAINHLTGGDPGDHWKAPTSMILDEQGNVVHNGGKVSLDDVFMAVGGQLMNSSVEETIGRYNRAAEWEYAQRNGFETVVLGAQHIGGMAIGFGMPGGAAMHAGQKVGQEAMMKGLGWLGGLGYTAGQTEKAKKILGIVAGTTGAAVANGVFEGTAYGRIEGYGKAFQHGAIMAPMLMGLGWVGRKTEKALRAKNVPASFAKYVSAGVEGMGFGVMELNDLSPLWRFIQDPSDLSWGEFSEVMAKNIMGMMLAKRMMGTTPGRMAPEIEAYEGRRGAREAAAREAVTPETEPMRREEIMQGAEEMGVPRETVERYGELARAREQAQATDPDLARKLGERMAQIEEEMDVREMGLERPELERQAEVQVRRIAARRKRAEGRAEEAEGIERVAEGLRSVGARLIARGTLEAKLERAGREVPQQAERMLPGEDVISRMQTGAQRREMAGRKGEVGLVVAGGEAIPIKGKAREISAEDVRRVTPEGISPEDVSVTHTHPSPTPASIADLATMARKVGKGPKSAPDFIVTPEAVYEVRVAEGAKSPSLAAETKGEARRKALTEASVKRIASEHGVSPRDAARAMKKWMAGKPLSAKEKAMAREFAAVQDQIAESIGKDFGLTIRRVEAAEASRTVGERMPERLAEEREVLSNRAFPAEGRFEHIEPRTTERIKASDIIREIEGRGGARGLRIPLIGKTLLYREGDPIRVPLRKKGFNQRGIRGYFETRQDIIRSQEAYDLNNAAHEFAHAMQSKTVGFKWEPKGAQAMNELMALAEPMTQPRMNTRQKIAEGWAEFWARDLLGDPNLAADHPALHRQLMEWMAWPENTRLASQYLRIKEAYRVWREQGAEARAIGEIEGGPTAKPSEQERKARSVQDRFEEVVGRLVDDTTKFKKSFSRWMDIAGHKTDDLPITMRPDKLLDLFRMTAAKRADFLMNVEMTDFAGNRTGKSMREVMEKLDSPAEELQFWAYMKRRRELEMMTPKVDAEGNVIREAYVTGVTQAEAIAAISRFESNKPKFIEMAEDLRTWFHGLVDLVTEAGGFTPQESGTIKEAYEAYIPFHRMVEAPGGRAAQGKQKISTAMRHVRGGTEPIMHPREAIARLTQSLIARAQQTYVMKALYNNYAMMEGLGGLITEVPRDKVPVRVPLKQLADTLEKIEVEGDLKHQLEGASDALQALVDGDFSAITLFSQATDPKGNRPVIAFTPKHTFQELESMLFRMELTGATPEAIDAARQRVYAQQGELMWFELDKQTFEVMKSIDAPPTFLAALAEKNPVLSKLFIAPTQVLRYFATGVSIPFMFRNIVRDSMVHGMYSKHGSWIPFAGVYYFAKGLGKAIRARMNKMHGDLFSALGGQAATHFGLEVTPGLKGVRVPGDKLSLLDKARLPFRVIEEAVSLTEQALRVEEFERTREKLRRQGKTEIEANLEALYDAKEVTVNFTRASAVTRSLNTVKAYFNAGVQGNRKFMRTVLGYEGAEAQDRAIKAGMANLTAMSALAYLLAGDEDWFKDLPEWRKVGYWNFKPVDGGPIVHIPKPHEPGLFFTLPFEKSVGELMDTNPVDTKTGLLSLAGGFLNNYQIIPDLLSPTIETGANYSFFRQRPIVPYWMEKSRKVEDQYTAYTTEAAKWIAQAIGVSPAKFEHFASGYSGGGFLSLSQAMDSLMGAGKDTRGFRGLGFAGQEHASSRAVDDLFALRKEIEQAAGSERAGVGRVSPLQRSFRTRVNNATDSVALLLRRAREGRISREDANRRAFLIANRVLSSYRKKE